MREVWQYGTEGVYQYGSEGSIAEWQYGSMSVWQCGSWPQLREVPVTRHGPNCLPGIYYTFAQYFSQPPGTVIAAETEKSAVLGAEQFQFLCGVTYGKKFLKQST